MVWYYYIVVWWCLVFEAFLLEYLVVVVMMMMMITVCFVPIDEFWVDISSFLASFGSVHFLSQDPNQVVLEELETVQRLFKNWCCCCYRKMVIISITIIACHCIFWGGEDSFKFCGTVCLYMELWGGRDEFVTNWEGEGMWLAY